MLIDKYTPDLFMKICKKLKLLYGSRFNETMLYNHFNSDQGNLELAHFIRNFDESSVSPELHEIDENEQISQIKNISS